MPKAQRQKPRDDTGRQRRTLELRDDDYGRWIADATRPATSNDALQRALRPFLENLTIPQADAVRLLFREGMSEREAAEKLGIERVTLRGRRDAALKALRQAIEAAAGAPGYAAARRWLTPARRIRDDGTEDRWERVYCSNCYVFVGEYLPNEYALAPHVSCPECAA